MIENAVLFGKSMSLVGILTDPTPGPVDPALPAVLLLNAGMLHRVGPNRIHVKLARKLAEKGIVTLRFDQSGIGDSSARTDALPVGKSSLADFREALEYIVATKGIERIVPIGICSGADLALRAAGLLDQVVGAVLINGGFIGETTSEELARSAGLQMLTRYYRKRIFDYKSWMRPLTGKSDIRKILEVVCSEAARLFRRRRPARESTPGGDWDAVVSRGVELLLIYSEGGMALDLFRIIHEKQLPITESGSRIATSVVEDCDHVFTPLWSQEVLLALICDWIVSADRPWLSTESVK